MPVKVLIRGPLTDLAIGAIPVHSSRQRLNTGIARETETAVCYCQSHISLKKKAKRAYCSLLIVYNFVLLF